MSVLSDLAEDTFVISKPAASTMPAKFLVVVPNGYAPPAVRYSSRYEAIRAAEDLATVNPNKTFYVAVLLDKITSETKIVTTSF